MMIQRLIRGMEKIKLSSLFKFFAILYIAHKLLPAVGHYMPSIIYAGIFVVLFALLYYSSQTLRKSHVSLFLMMFSVSLLSLASRITSGGDVTSIITYIYGELQIALFAFIALWYINFADLKTTRRFLFILILFYVITAVTTYIGCVRFPQAARYLAANDSETAEFRLYAATADYPFCLAHL